jgi:hypothetical protein
MLRRLEEPGSLTFSSLSTAAENLREDLDWRPVFFRLVAVGSSFSG